MDLWDPTKDEEFESFYLHKIIDIPYAKIPYKANICIDVSVEFESIIDVPIILYVVRVYCNDTLMREVIVQRGGDCCLNSDIANDLRKKHLYFSINLANHIVSNLERTVFSKGLSLNKSLRLQIEINNLENIEGYTILYDY